MAESRGATGASPLPLGGGAPPAFDLHDLRMEFRAGGSVVIVLDVPRLTVPAGVAVGIAGPSGSGKTTLLNIITGILTPTAGEMQVCGVAVAALSPAERDRFRAERIGYVFQTFNLIPPLSALENVLLPMGFGACVPREERRARAEALLTRVGLSHRLKHKPGEMSHGEMQRVGIARALANRPRLIVADEPTASLEPGLSRDIVRLLIEVARQELATLLIASHDPSVLQQLPRVEDMASLNLAAAPAPA